MDKAYEIQPCDCSYSRHDTVSGLKIGLKKEHSMTPAGLVDELKPGERGIFRLLFTGGAYRKIYRLYELEG